MSSALDQPLPPDGDPWAVLRRATRARVALGRAGDALPTSRELEFRVAHAAARDAVHQPLDPGVVRDLLPAHEVLEVHSAAPDRAIYLQRPDLGRRLAEGTSLPRADADLAVVIADGLSPRAVHEHAAGLTTALLERLSGWTVAPLVVAHQARVALGDAVGAALGVRAVVVLIGERPGLSSADSLGVYLTWDPRPGRADSERNCVSNVRPPHGLSYAQAADTVAALLSAARELGASGVALKDEGPALPAGAG
ncbi:ethanolamine ammonia-lyase subunit EutC [Geodermatophilus sabuli]|uniref:Ethanolamine ammonia-lyase small subunit n=1 Tax=Geodermatophilus sabuli TaxID=1564158 RepID=A0A285EB62_9ACTN|nr:ethanolamine ammonia-lyase subunit EutC [Geodermatophilus sabuli]MBB3085355.1 ethanolamine ammonia-lyase small subunit [Geodermatophilus sabuli]SNX96217.1 Ethanolamine ammonia-lyase light chain [Geodermatophilus sabuli]